MTAQMTLEAPALDTAEMSVVADTIKLPKEVKPMTTASISRVTRIHSRRTPHGFDAFVYRVGLSLAGWAHRHAQSQILDRDERQRLVDNRLSEQRRELAAQSSAFTYVARTF